jgi:nucleoside-diphosphate kinase
MERTFIAIKPDGVQRGLVGQLVQRFEQKGLKLVGLKLMQVSEALAKQHYAEHAEKPFFGSLVGFITSGPIVAMVWEGPNAITQCRTLMGATKPEAAAPGTIRFDYGVYMERNLVHGSDGPESAQREIGLFFSPEELLSYTPTLSSWIVG